MLDFEALQPTARDLIAAHSYLSDIKVFANEGLTEKPQEKELREKGVVIAISPVLGGSQKDERQGIALIEVDLMARIRINPERNADEDSGAQKDPCRLIRSVIEAIQAYDFGQGDQPFSFDGEQVFSLIPDDEGLIAYGVHFSKVCVFIP